MILFDKIKKALFTEVDEEEYVEEIEEINEDDFTIKEKSVVYEKRPEAKKEPLKAAPIPQQPEKDVSATTTAVNIRADGPATPKVERKLKPLERKEFEIPVVISPITGSKEEEQVPQTNLSGAPLEPKTIKTNKNILGTVISPFYGTGELEEFQAKAQVDIASEKISDQMKDTFVDEEAENISLDKIVSPVVEEENEMIQFSLFGEDKPVRDFSDEGSSKDEEADEDLPF